MKLRTHQNVCDKEKFGSPNRKDRNPYLRPTPPSLFNDFISNGTSTPITYARGDKSPSSFSSTFSSSGASVFAVAPPPGAAAAAPPPDPTLSNISLTFLPSSACDLLGSKHVKDFSLAQQYFCKESRPYRLTFYFSSFDNCLKLIDLRPR